MIKLVCENFEIIPKTINFPDGTFKIDVEIPENAVPCTIIWTYENESEFIQLIYLTEYLHERNYRKFGLYMPYIPNARMDRVKNSTEVFTLKYFCKIINSLGFDFVSVLDPHSAVSESLIDRIRIVSPEKYIRKAVEISGISLKDDYIFFPDEGSCKRYSEFFSGSENSGFGIKKRDWKTGKILGLDIHGNSPENKDIFIIDDICSYGGTVYHSALKLKELGCKNIYVYFTHCENSIAKGELLKGDLIRHIYTTNSLFSLDTDKYSDKITVIDCLTKGNYND